MVLAMLPSHLSTISNVALLFENEPRRWGLRGDLYLWREMREHFNDVPRSTSPTVFDQLLQEAFETLTGRPLESDEYFQVERFCHGGVSSGMICPPWWKETGFPLLRARHHAT